MDSVSNGCSKEHFPEVCDRMTTLCQHSTLFINLYNKKEVRLRDLHAEIQEIGTQVRKWDTKSKWSFYTGVVSAAIAVAAGLTVPFTGAVGFAITAALMSAAAGGAVFGFKIKQFRTEEESLKKIKQFLNIMNRLEHELDELILQSKQEKAELPDGLLKLLRSMDTFRAADGVYALTAQCQVVFHELDNVRKQLQEPRGSTEGEDPQQMLSSRQTADTKESRESTPLLDGGNKKADD